MGFGGVQFLGACVGSGSNDLGAGLGPISLAPHFNDSLHLISENRSGRAHQALPGILEFNMKLASLTSLVKSKGKFPVVLGGDHSCAMGTWSGISDFHGKPLGLLWIDAHMDAHTFETSETGNIHGMPLATLMGYGDKELSQLMFEGPKVDPARTVLFGVRSFESSEAKLLEQLQVRVFFMGEILSRGFEVCWNEALAIVDSGKEAFGVSLDLDGLDPKLIPGVGTPVVLGLSAQKVYEGLIHLLENPRLSALEIVEYNPLHDRDFVTGNYVLKLCDQVEKILGNRSHSKEFQI